MRRGAGGSHELTMREAPVPLTNPQRGKGKRRYDWDWDMIAHPAYTPDSTHTSTCAIPRAYIYGVKGIKTVHRPPSTAHLPISPNSAPAAGHVVSGSITINSIAYPYLSLARQHDAPSRGQEGRRDGQQRRHRPSRDIWPPPRLPPWYASYPSLPARRQVNSGSLC
jgi:hypothetical protein